MDVVTLVSGGLDSTLLAYLIREEGLDQLPLFIDYGQLGRTRELESCRRNMRKLGLKAPRVVRFAQLGKLMPCGLTDTNKHIVNEAFLPGRNAMFVTLAASVARYHGARVVAIGLLDEAFSIFPDQTRSFLFEAQGFLSRSLGVTIRVRAPLMTFSKKDVVAAAKSVGIAGTYSCHAGGARPCGKCISCREFIGAED